MGADSNIRVKESSYLSTHTPLFMLLRSSIYFEKQDYLLFCSKNNVIYIRGLFVQLKSFSMNLRFYVTKINPSSSAHANWKRLDAYIDSNLSKD